MTLTVNCAKKEKIKQKEARNDQFKTFCRKRTVNWLLGI